MKSRIALAVVIAALVLGPLLALAEHVEVTDPDDASGLLDVRVVRMIGEESPIWSIITYPRWNPRQIWDRGYFLIYLDTFGNSEYDYRALVRGIRSSLKADLFRIRPNRMDRRIGDLSAYRDGPRHVAVAIPLGLMRVDEKRTFYRWYVQTLFTNNGPCPDVCFDVVPSEVGIVEPIGSPSPSPSGSPTPSSLPTLP